MPAHRARGPLHDVFNAHRPSKGIVAENRALPEEEFQAAEQTTHPSYSAVRCGEQTPVPW